MKTRTDVYGLFIFNILVAAAFVVVGFLIAKYILKSNVVSSVPLIIMAVGLVPLGKAFGPLNYYFSSLKIAKEKKERLNKICKLYGYNYNINIEHLKDSLGNKSYNTDLKIRRTKPTNY